MLHFTPMSSIVAVSPPPASPASTCCQRNSSHRQSLIHRLHYRPRTAGVICAAVVGRRDGVRARRQLRGSELCRASAQGHSLQQRRANVEGNFPSRRPGELRRHRRRKGHRLPSVRRIQRRSQSGRSRGFVYRLTQCLRRATSEVRVSTVRGLDRLCTHCELRGRKASRAPTQQ